MDLNLLGIIKTDCIQWRDEVIDIFRKTGLINTPEGQSLEKSANDFLEAIGKNINRLKESADDTTRMPSRAEQAKRLLTFIKEEMSKQGKPITICESQGDLLQIIAVPSYEYLENLFDELEDKGLVRGDTLLLYEEGERKIEDVSLTIEGDQHVNRWTT